MAGANPLFTFGEGAAIVGTISGIVDAAGNPTQFKAAPAWTSSDTSLLSLAVAADGLSATGTLAAKTGNVNVTIVGDGITVTAVINIVAGVVAGFQVTFSPAPPPPPPAAGA